MDPILEENGFPLFRFWFFKGGTDEYCENQLIGESVEANIYSIHSCFTAYLRSLKEGGV
ncbi:MAG: hypothetical protein ACYSTS_11295 [Planctomycetota bacterium]|jgi:hypothetical protein